MALILMVSQPTVAGVAHCVVDWSVGLAGIGWDVVVACPSDGVLEADCRDAGIPVRTWESVRSPTSGVVRETRDLGGIIDRLRPDVVVLHSSKAGLAGRLAVRGAISTVFAPHAWSFDAATGVTARAALAWERLAVRWTDRVLCVSEAEAQRGRQAGIRGRFVVARNGVDIGRLQERLAAAAPLPPSPAPVTVVCVGRLSRQKGQDVLLRAWPQVPEGLGARLVLVGGGPDEDRMRALAGGRDDITFTGDVDRDTALQWLAAADLAVVPSRWEGMALVPLEALALGVPVVASDVTGVREAVGDAGALVPPDDAGALGAELRRWCTMPAEQRAAAGARGAERIRTDFTTASTVAVISTMLEDLLGTPATRDRR